MTRYRTPEHATPERWRPRVTHERWHQHPWVRRDIKEILFALAIALCIAIPTTLIVALRLLTEGG